MSQVAVEIVQLILSRAAIQDEFCAPPWWMHEQEGQRECQEIWEGPWGQYLLSFEGSRVSVVVVVVAPPGSGPVLVLGVVIAPVVVFVVVVAPAAAGGHSGQSPLQAVVVG